MASPDPTDFRRPPESSTLSFPLLTPTAPPDVADFDRLRLYDGEDQSEQDAAEHLEEQFFVEWEVPEAV